MAEAEYKSFPSDGDAVCYKCRTRIGPGKGVWALPPCEDSGRTTWTKLHCQPSCEEAAGRPDGPLPPPRTRIFKSRFESTMCCRCDCYIKVDDMMEAVVCPGETPKWQQTKHYPRCPPNDIRAIGRIGGFGGGGG